ncbi:PadR family transcriptional regulator [Paenibacillus apiarius]|uniref:PadR family transcriptional regulator n=1 Tax=Paenibacillus apiarius TaxID=46240 RepID=UPI003B3A75BE
MDKEVEPMSMKLAILGLLMDKDYHPYEMSQEMKEREMHNYMKLQYGSLYYAIEQLKKSGLIETVEVISGGARPDKTIYRITKQGESEFQRMLLEEMKLPPHLLHPFFAALSFVKYGDQEEIKAIIRARIEAFEKEVERMWALYEEHVPSASRAVLHMLYGGYRYTVTELNWLKELYKDAEANRLGDVGEPLPVVPLHKS